jgi:hypothetical protein
MSLIDTPFYELTYPMPRVLESPHRVLTAGKHPKILRRKTQRREKAKGVAQATCHSSIVLNNRDLFTIIPPLWSDWTHKQPIGRSHAVFVLLWTSPGADKANAPLFQALCVHRSPTGKIRHGVAYRGANASLSTMMDCVTGCIYDGDVRASLNPRSRSNSLRRRRRGLGCRFTLGWVDLQLHVFVCRARMGAPFSRRSGPLWACWS